MTPAAYLAMARHLRKVADDLENRCRPTSPRERAALTSTLNTLARYTKLQASRHRADVAARHGAHTPVEDEPDPAQDLVP
jgi:hypothetical protein